MSDKRPRIIESRDLDLARKRIGNTARVTPLLECPFLGEEMGRPVFLKCENLQLTGSFKIRGALSHILALESGRGVVTASSGNHGQAVAYAARMAGLSSTVVMPENAVANKVAAVRTLGAEVVLHGTVSGERKDLARTMAQEQGLSFVDSTDDDLVISGQGSLALEVLEQMPDVEAIISPIGGGGLISGISSAVKLNRPEVKVIGVEPREAAAMYHSIRSGGPVLLDKVDTIADGLRTARPGPLTFAHVSAFVDDIVLAEEDDIIPMMVRLARKAKLVVEPSGAVGACGLKLVSVPGSGPLVVIITGGNVDLSFLARVLGS